MKITEAVRRVVIVANTEKPRALEIQKQLQDWLSKRSIEVVDGSHSELDSVLSEADLFICIGGDGTILRLAGKMVGCSIPVLGVNAGGLGFLTEVRAEELYDELKTILLGSFEVEERMLLSASIKTKPQEKEQRFQALNDVVVSREGLSRYLLVEVEVDGETATRFPGDGVIIATPTGSTAYSLSAGGPIVHPRLDDIIITPICPHASALRSLVVSGEQTVRVRVTCDNVEEKALVSIDGQSDVPIDNDSVVEVTRSITRFLLVKSSKRSYFGTLGEKFKLPM